MTLIEVVSSNIKRVGWENKTLFVEFNTGLYEYSNVEEDVYKRLLESESKGKFIRAEIIGKYDYKKSILK